MNKDSVIVVCTVCMMVLMIVPSGMAADEYDEYGEYGIQPGLDSSGAGYGGMGVVTSEPISNIISAETQKKNIVANVSTTYDFTFSEFAIYNVTVKDAENEDFVCIRVEHLNDMSRLVSTNPAGIIYANENVWVGSKSIYEMRVKFRIKNVWINDNNVRVDDVRLLEWNNDTWKQLNTNVIAKDETYTYFESLSPLIHGQFNDDSSSIFSIISQKNIDRVITESPNDYYRRNNNVSSDTNSMTVRPGVVPAILVIGVFGILSLLVIGSILLKRNRT